MVVIRHGEVAVLGRALVAAKVGGGGVGGGGGGGDSGVGMNDHLAIRRRRR